VEAAAEEVAEEVEVAAAEEVAEEVEVGAAVVGAAAVVVAAVVAGSSDTCTADAHGSPGPQRQTPRRPRGQATPRLRRRSTTASMTTAGRVSASLPTSYLVAPPPTSPLRPHPAIGFPPPDANRPTTKPFSQKPAAGASDHLVNQQLRKRHPERRCHTETPPRPAAAPSACQWRGCGTRSPRRISDTQRSDSPAAVSG